MKKINIPYIESLNTSTIELSEQILLESGQREAVDNLNWKEAFPYRPITTFHIAHSLDAIYIRFFVRGSMLRAIYSNDQDPVYEDSCVEFFCMKPADEYYANFEFNCIGTCLATKRKSLHEGIIPFTREQMLTVERYSSIGKRPFKELEGMFSWDLTVKIPFALLGFEKGEKPTQLLANFYKCADGTESPHYLSWNPIVAEKPNFHLPQFFGELNFS